MENCISALHLELNLDYFIPMKYEKIYLTYKNTNDFILKNQIDYKKTKLIIVKSH